MSKLVPGLMRHFQLELVEGSKEKEWRTVNRWFVKVIDFKVKVVLRGQKGEGDG